MSTNLSAPIVSAAEAQGTILVVDDDSATRRALRVTLAGMGFTVVEAARGEEALSLVRVTMSSMRVSIATLAFAALLALHQVHGQRRDERAREKVGGEHGEDD